MALPPTTLPQLPGKVAVITGAASCDIGKAIGTKFVTAGARVILADKKLYDCQTLADNINKNVGTQMAKAMEWDVVKDPNDTRHAIRLAKETYGRDLDIFYNHAWFNNLNDDGLSSTDVDSIKKAMSVNNVAAVLESIKQASDAMSGGGCILCTGSTMGLLGDVVPSAYTVSMSALMVAIRAAAADVASKNVRVNVISPHCVKDNTSFDERVLHQIFPGADAQERRRLIDKFAGKRVVSADDVANAAVFLASDYGKSVNGHNLVLSGKFTL